MVGTGLLAGSDRRWIWDGTRLVEYIAARPALERLLWTVHSERARTSQAETV